VVDLEGRDPVTVALQLVIRLDLGELHAEREPADHRLEQRVHAPQAARPVDRERALALAEREGLQHPRQAEHVVGVEVGDEQLLELDQADRAHELPLRALAAVEQQPVAAAPHEGGGQPAPRAGRGARRPQKEHVQIHQTSKISQRAAPLRTWIRPIV
jgi:hypothetical protein